MSYSYYLTHVTGQKTRGIIKGMNGIDTGYKNPYLERSEWGWGIDPTGLRFSLNLLYEGTDLARLSDEDWLTPAYRNALTDQAWGEKRSYDLCLDSDLLGREKCAEILVCSLRDCEIDPEHAKEVVARMMRTYAETHR